MLDHFGQKSLNKPAEVQVVAARILRLLIFLQLLFLSCHSNCCNMTSCPLLPGCGRIIAVTLLVPLPWPFTLGIVPSCRAVLGPSIGSSVFSVSQSVVTDHPSNNHMTRASWQLQPLAVPPNTVSEDSTCRTVTSIEAYVFTRITACSVIPTNTASLAMVASVARWQISQKRRP